MQCPLECSFFSIFFSHFCHILFTSIFNTLFLLTLKIIRSNQFCYSYLSLCHIKIRSRKKIKKDEKGMIMGFQVDSFPEWLTAPIAELPQNSASFSPFPSCASVSLCSLLLLFLLLFLYIAGICHNFPLELSWGKLDSWEFKQDEKEKIYRRAMLFLIKNVLELTPRSKDNPVSKRKGISFASM